MSTTRIPVRELQIGMYVARLDLSWFRSPLLRHSFLIEHPSQIEKLVRAGVKMVDIDLQRGIASHPLQVSDTKHSATEAAPTWSIKKQSKPLAQLNEEYVQAKLAKQQMDQAVQSVFTTITKTGTVNPQQATEAVQEITIAMRTLTDSAIFMALSQNRAGDSTLSRHALATCTLSLVLGQAFQFNPLELQELATAALLHDIGLLQIRPAIVRHAHAASGLSKTDQQELETHPRRAVLMLERQGRIEAATLHHIANHHVYLDDSGYPKESRGRFTSDRTRILMVVDRYDELITGFGGTASLTPHQTFQRLYQEARQGKLDQRILSSFIARVGIYPVHSHVRLNTQELAVVTELNQDKLHQPIITITHQPGGTEYVTPLVVDLAHQADEPQTRAIETIIAMNT
jgi:HD-GYP domain-containing protein (c-di-GMP phosphodiesterase class II)